MASFTRIQLESWLKNIDVKDNKVLDVGGSQNPIKGRTKSWDVNNYKILDLEKPHECKQEPDIIVDLNKEMYAVMPKKFSEFDVAFCIEVSEYWWHPVKALENINQLLKKGGLLYISFHFIYPCHNPIDQDYLRYTPEGAKKLIRETGFEILEVEPRVESDNSLLMPAFTVEEMRPAKGYTRHHWVGCIIKCKKK